MYYVYVISDKEGEIYIGYTNDLERRISEHNSSKNVGYTRNQKWQYVYYEAYTSKIDAILREKRLKSHGQSKRQLKARIQESLKIRDN